VWCSVIRVGVDEEGLARRGRERLFIVKIARPTRCASSRTELCAVRFAGAPSGGDAMDYKCKKIIRRMDRRA
jgi:hypothetical protein